MNLKRFYLAFVLFCAGVATTVVHDYAYRRADDGTGDYELDGLITHAGTDMLIVTVFLTVIAVGWNWKNKSD